MLFSKKKFIHGLILFLLSRIVAMICAHSNGYNFFNVQDYSHWDSGHYLGIADSGYSLYKCCEENINYPNCSDWGGHSGWFPFYPYLIRLFSTVLNHFWSGYLISAIFQLGVINLLLSLLPKKESIYQTVLTSLAIIFFFGNIYYQAIFPVSLFLFFILLIISLVQNERFISASLVGALAVFTYPSGLWLLIILPVYIIFLSQLRLTKISLKISFSSFIIILTGYIAIMIIQQKAVGHWNAFFLVQSTYGHGINIPTKYIKRYIIEFMNTPFLSDQFWVLLQTMTVLIFILILISFSIISKIKIY